MWSLQHKSHIAFSSTINHQSLCDRLGSQVAHPGIPGGGGGGVTFILLYLVITVRLILFALDWVRLRFGLVFVGLDCVLD